MSHGNFKICQIIMMKLCKEKYFSMINGILFPKLFRPNMRNSCCSSDQEKLLKLEAEGREFIRIVKGQYNF